MSSADFGGKSKDETIEYLIQAYNSMEKKNAELSQSPAEAKETIEEYKRMLFASRSEKKHVGYENPNQLTLPVLICGSFGSAKNQENTMTYGEIETEAQKYWKYQMSKIISEYEHKYKFYSTKEGPAYCYLGSKEIYIPESYWKHPYSAYAFNVYHEIGHLETNTEDMETYQQEYLATVWAIHAMNERKLYIAPGTITSYQNYIAGYRNESVDRGVVSDGDIALPAALNVGSNRNVTRNRMVSGNEESSVMDLVSYLKSRNVEFVDNRMKGGNLTIVGTEPNIGELVDTICLAYGITGKYGSSLRAIKHRAGWWTQGRKVG